MPSSKIGTVHPKVGPTLDQVGDRPWDRWEQDPHVHDGHEHVWESVLLVPPAHFHLEEVVRCEDCHAPRCGDLHEEHPCLLVRHHRDPHMDDRGRLRPVGAGVVLG